MLQHGNEQDGTFKSLFISVLVTAALLYFVIGQLGANHSATLKPEKLPDFDQYQDIDQRKQAFFDYLSKRVTIVNQQIQQQRSEVVKLATAFEQEQTLTQDQWERVFEIAKEYRVDEAEIQPSPDLLLKLKRRVAPIPESLVLAQAANESAWGRSRFAKEGNNLFGQWCFEPGCGIVPKNRPEGETYEVAQFARPIDSVRSYMMNLNTFHAYSELRSIRYNHLEQGKKVSGSLLAEGLEQYSTRGEEYVKEIQLMIEQNELEAR
ncbi:MAG: glucosaminidase domain-containing protein [Gammaproteobacteria bacterium]|nr:glucosaminidase domain-containing protein [Gammaproteobacteria bacterium]